MNTNMALLTALFAGLVAIKAVFGLDADFQVDLIRELELANATHGISQIAGLHNSSKAFLFQDGRRSFQVPSQIAEHILELLRNKNEFTFMASVQQKAATSGVLFSIHESEYSYFELESCGLREEISYRIYEREIDPSKMDLSAGSGIWLGQRSHRHRFFKGSMQDVRFVFALNGYMVQCPGLNRTCPTCSDFLNLVQGIMDLQELLAKMALKLNSAESRLGQLERCRCDRTCSIDGVAYHDKELWTDPENCRTCTCTNGAVKCHRIFCPPVNCSADQLPGLVNGTCCKKCRPKCSFLGRALSEGQRIFLRSCKECKNGAMEAVNETCPSLNCTIHQQILPENRCCSICIGHDFCAEGVLCGENAVCKNRDDKAECECNAGYVPIQGESTYCEDINECSTNTHFCQDNTRCVNLPGGHRCDCLPGFSRVDDFSCTESDECVSIQNVCDENAICTNTVRGHLCACKPEFMGNGTVCTAVCRDACLNGGTCVSPNECWCPSGFAGRLCETDVDECVEGLARCHIHSVCSNLPGRYKCQCRSGFHDDGSRLPDGSSCVDIDECMTHAHTCRTASECRNLAGSFMCQGDHVRTDERKRNGREPRPGRDWCANKGSEVLREEDDGDSTILEIGQTCDDSAGIPRAGGSVWRDPGAPCTVCTCKNGKICCSVDLDCVRVH